MRLIDEIILVNLVTSRICVRAALKYSKINPKIKTIKPNKKTNRKGRRC